MGGYGLALAVYAVGALVSNLLVGSRPGASALWLMLGGRLLVGLSFVAWAKAPGDVWLVLGGMLGGLGSPMVDIPFFDLICRETQPEHVGKLFALRIMAVNPGILAGTLAVAPVIAWLGPALALGGLGMLNIRLAAIGTIRFAGRIAR